MTTHVLKTDKEPFVAVWEGKKKAELRYDDRNFEEGDTLILYCEEVSSCITCLVTHIQEGYCLPSGYIMLSISVVQKLRNASA